MPLIRDKEYYFEDGTCIFQADDHLFKIHHFLLTRESPFIESMFSLPQRSVTSQGGMDVTEKAYEGGSDDNPIIFQDSAASFRALCWGLYIRPLEVHEQEGSANVDLSRLIALGSIAHKYEFTLLEGWAIGTLQKHWLSAFDSLNKPRESPWTLGVITQLLAFSTKTNAIDQEFKNALESQWLSSLGTITEDPSNIQWVLDTADSSLSRRACSLTYYRVFRRLDVCRLRPGSFFKLGPFRKLSLDAIQYPNAGILAELSHNQRLKLMHGFWCLAQLCGVNSLGQMPFECTKGPDTQPLLSDNNSEKPQAGVPKPDCRWNWELMAGGLPNTLDFGAMVEGALRRLEHPTGWTPLGEPCTHCKQQLVVELRSALASFEDNLPNYFVLP